MKKRLISCLNSVRINPIKYGDWPLKWLKHTVGQQNVWPHETFFQSWKVHIFPHEEYIKCSALIPKAALRFCWGYLLSSDHWGAWIKTLSALARKIYKVQDDGGRLSNAGEKKDERGMVMCLIFWFDVLCRNGQKKTGRRKWCVVSGFNLVSSIHLNPPIYSYIWLNRDTLITVLLLTVKISSQTERVCLYSSHFGYTGIHHAILLPFCSVFYEWQEHVFLSLSL